jgi:hypothetical protein
MGKYTRLIYLFALLALVGCSHPIIITPELQFLDRKTLIPIEKNVGYYISVNGLFEVSHFRS